MIKEQDVLSILPQSSWLTNYVKYCQSQTTSPLAYQLGVGLSLLCISTPINYTIRWFGKVPTNMYCLLAGRSGDDQKSTALGLGEEILDMADFNLIGEQPASAEGLVNSLAENQKQSIWYSEFGQFLSQSKGGYMESVKTTYTNLWDGKNITRRKANETIRAEDPRLSIVGACSIPYLEQYTTAQDWTGGFMGRWLLLYAHRERTMPFPMAETLKVKQMREYLAGKLQEFLRTDYNSTCLGLDQDAQKLWSQWYSDLHSRDLPSIISGTNTRCPSIAIRIAMAMAWDLGISRQNEDWYITEDVLQFSVNVAELHLKSVISLADKLAETPYAIDRRKVLQCFYTNEGICSIGQLLGMTKMRKYQIIEIIDGLCLEGILDPIQMIGDQKFYEIKR